MPHLLILLWLCCESTTDRVRKSYSFHSFVVLVAGCPWPVDVCGDINIGGGIDLEACTQSYIQLSDGGLTNHHNSVSGWEHQGWCQHPSEINQRDLMHASPPLFQELVQFSHYSYCSVSMFGSSAAAECYVDQISIQKLCKCHKSDLKCKWRFLQQDLYSIEDSCLYICLKSHCSLVASLFHPPRSLLSLKLMKAPWLQSMIIIQIGSYPIDFMQMITFLCTQG